LAADMGLAADMELIVEAESVAVLALAE